MWLSYEKTPLSMYLDNGIHGEPHWAGVEIKVLKDSSPHHLPCAAAHAARPRLYREKWHEFLAFVENIYTLLDKEALHGADLLIIDNKVQDRSCGKDL